MNNGKLRQSPGLSLIVFWVLVASFNGHAQIPDKPDKNFIPGGQFKDLVLPMPIHGQLEDKNIWGAENVIPRDIQNGIEDNGWSYWGGNPVREKTGNIILPFADGKKRRAIGGGQNQKWHIVFLNIPQVRTMLPEQL